MRGLEVLEFVAPKTGAFVRGMGAPVEVDSVSRAAVIYNGKDSEIKFALNEEFSKTLTDNELAAVLAHEAHHIILQHLQERYEKIFENDDYIVKAHECIINDQIPVRFGLNLPEDTYSGPRDFNADFSDLSSAEGYAIIEEFYKNQDEDEPEDSNDDSEGEDGGDSDSSDSSSSDGDSSESGTCDGIILIDTDESDDLDDAIVKALDDVLSKSFDGQSWEDIARELGDDTADAIEDAMDGSGYSMSDAPDNQFSGATHISDGSVTSWEDLIRLIDPGDGSDVANWNRYNPAITILYPRVILPTYRKSDDGNSRGRRVIVLALDFSISIPAHLLDTLVSMADMIPNDRVLAKVITWSDTVCVYDESKRTCKRSGTHFGNMVRWVHDEEERTGQEHHIVCVSDGGFRSSDVPYDDERLHYLALPGTNARQHRFSHVYDFENFVKIRSI